MKKTIAIALLSFCFCHTYAQDSTLKEYVGKYTFPEGSAITSAEILLNGNSLNVNSPHGSSELVKKAKDTFAITAFDGMAYFLRNTEGKISGIKVDVADILLEGTKDVTLWLNRNTYMILNKKNLAK